MGDTRRDETTRTVERTRREVMRMEVEDECMEKQASKKLGRTVDKMVNMAKEGWSKIKGLLDGKRLVRDTVGSWLWGRARPVAPADRAAGRAAWDAPAPGGGRGSGDRGGGSG
jgi:hypothetical protein